MANDPGSPNDLVPLISLLRTEIPRTPSPLSTYGVEGREVVRRDHTTRIRQGSLEGPFLFIR